MLYSLIAQQVLKTTSWCVGRSPANDFTIQVAVPIPANTMKCAMEVWHSFIHGSLPLWFFSLPLDGRKRQTGTLQIQVAHLARRATGASDTLAVCGVDFAWAAIKAQRWERREYFCPRNEGFLEDCPLPWKFTRVAIGTRNQSLIGTWLLREHNKSSAWKQVSWERWRTWNPSTWNDMLIRPLHKLW